MALWLYLVFVVSWFLHLPARVPALGAIRFDLLLMASIAVLIVVAKVGSGIPVSHSRSRRVLLFLVGYIIATIPLVEWPGSVIRFGIPEFLKAVSFYFFTVYLVRTPRQLMLLTTTFVGCQLFRVIEPVYLHVTQGYWGSAASMAGWEQMNRLAGAPADVINPNGLAFVILTVLPFCHYLATMSRWRRATYLAALPILLYALMLTGSRSGLIGMAVVIGAVWVKSRHKVLMAAVLMVGLAVMVPSLSADLADRYASIVSSQTLNSGTFVGRIEGVKADLVVALRRPIVGHGLGTSLEANANFGTGMAQRSHNLFAEIAQELGFVGVVIFSVFIYSVLASLVRVHRAMGQSTDPPPFALAMVSALQVFMAMNLVFSLASYGLSSYEWYLAAGLADAVTAAFLPTSDLAESSRVGLKTAAGPIAVARVV